MDVQEVIIEIKKKLPEYLEGRGVTIKGGYTSGTMSCPIPGCSHTRGDVLNSAQLQVTSDGGMLVFCHASKASWDIFKFANAIDGMVIGHDERFYTETVPTLATHFGLTYDTPVATDEQKAKMKYYRAYRDAVDIISGRKDLIENLPAVTERSFKLSDVDEFELGGVESDAKFIYLMEERGWKRKYLDELGLTTNNIFRAGSLLIPIRDPLGRAIAFAARHPYPNDENLVKYVNTTNNGVYKKGNLLFNLHTASKLPGDLWVVEGYTDAMAMTVAGHPKVISPGTNGIGRQQIELLDKYSLYNIVLCFDGDDKGRQGSKQSVRLFASNPKFKVRVLDLTDCDPEDYLRTHTIDEMKNLPTRSSFEYVLHKEYPNPTMDDIVEHIIGDIVAHEVSPIRRDAMLVSIEDHTGYSKDILKDELSAALEKMDASKRVRQETLVNNAMFKLNDKSTHNPLGIAEQLVHDLKAVNSEEKVADIDAGKLDVLRESVAEWRKNDVGIKGYVMPNFSYLEKALNGFPRHGCMMTIGGTPSSGKSTLARNIAWEVATNNADCQCIYMSIDDSKKTATLALIGQISDLEVEKEVEMHRALVHRCNRDGTPEKLQRWDSAIESYTKQENLVLVDDSDGRSIASLTRTIDYCLDKRPMQKPIVIIDNFHILDGLDNKEMRMRTMDNVITLKHLCSEYDIPVMTLVQLNKSLRGTVPVPEDIQETAQVGYESDMIIMLHSELQSNPLDTTRFWTYADCEGDVAKMPYTEAFVHKNKSGRFKSMDYESTLYFMINRYTSRMTQTRYSDLPGNRREDAAVDEPDGNWNV